MIPISWEPVYWTPITTNNWFQTIRLQTEFIFSFSYDMMKQISEIMKSCNKSKDWVYCYRHWFNSLEHGTHQDKDKNCMLDLVSLWNEWNGLLQNKKRESDAGGKRCNFSAKLDWPFYIGSSDAIGLQEIMTSFFTEERWWRCILFIPKSTEGKPWTVTKIVFRLKQNARSKVQSEYHA